MNRGAPPPWEPEGGPWEPPSQEDLDDAFRKARSVVQPVIQVLFITTAAVAAVRCAWREAKRALPPSTAKKRRGP
jgi:hypothetical protein